MALAGSIMVAVRNSGHARLSSSAFQLSLSLILPYVAHSLFTRTSSVSKLNRLYVLHKSENDRSLPHASKSCCLRILSRLSSFQNSACNISHCCDNPYCRWVLAHVCQTVASLLTAPLSQHRHNSLTHLMILNYASTYITYLHTTQSKPPHLRVMP